MSDRDTVSEFWGPSVVSTTTHGEEMETSAVDTPTTPQGPTLNPPPEVSGNAPAPGIGTNIEPSRTIPMLPTVQPITPAVNPGSQTVFPLYDTIPFPAAPSMMTGGLGDYQPLPLGASARSSPYSNATAPNTVHDNTAEALWTLHLHGAQPGKEDMPLYYAFGDERPPVTPYMEIEDWLKRMEQAFSRGTWSSEIQRQWLYKHARGTLRVWLDSASNAGLDYPTLKAKIIRAFSRIQTEENPMHTVTSLTRRAGEQIFAFALRLDAAGEHYARVDTTVTPQTLRNLLSWTFLGSLPKEAGNVVQENHSFLDFAQNVARYFERNPTHNLTSKAILEAQQSIKAVRQKPEVLAVSTIAPINPVIAQVQSIQGNTASLEAPLNSTRTQTQAPARQENVPKPVCQLCGKYNHTALSCRLLEQYKQATTPASVVERKKVGFYAPQKGHPTSVGGMVAAAAAKGSPFSAAARTCSSSNPACGFCGRIGHRPEHCYKHFEQLGYPRCSQCRGWGHGTSRCRKTNKPTEERQAGEMWCTFCQNKGHRIHECRTLAHFQASFQAGQPKPDTTQPDNNSYPTKNV